RRAVRIRGRTGRWPGHSWRRCPPELFEDLAEALDVTGLVHQQAPQGGPYSAAPGDTDVGNGCRCIGRLPRVDRHALRAEQVDEADDVSRKGLRHVSRASEGACHQVAGLVALDSRDVVAMLEQHPEGPVDDGGLE